MDRIYTLVLDKQVKKFLQTHPEMMKRFFDKLQFLVVNPMDSRLDIKPYEGKENCRRLRIGKYRFLYEIIEQTITVYFFAADSR